MKCGKDLAHSCKRSGAPVDKLGNVCSEGMGLPRKHHCPDCKFCQLCSDSRCSSCLRDRESEQDSKKLSFSEQIRLYNEINSKDPLLGKNPK